MEYHKAFIEGRYLKLPILDSIHLVIYDRLKTFGYLKDMPKTFSEEEIKAAMADLKQIGWLDKLQNGVFQ